VLSDYQLEIVDIRMDRLDNWQLPQAEVDKLLDPAIKIFCLVNPSNPPSSKLSDAVLEQLAALVAQAAGPADRHR
jgi:aspartate 4-decarboxylase